MTVRGKETIDIKSCINSIKTIKAELACIASVFARVSRESWDESKKKKGMTGETVFFRSRSKFRTITLLETLATQAKAERAYSMLGGKILESQKIIVS